MRHPNNKKISKFFFNFSVSVTPELLPPAILPQVLPATRDPAASAEDHREGYYLLPQDLQVRTLFRSVSDAGREVPQEVSFWEIADWQRWAWEPKETRKLKRVVVHLLTKQECKLWISNEASRQQKNYRHSPSSHKHFCLSRIHCPQVWLDKPLHLYEYWVHRTHGFVRYATVPYKRRSDSVSLKSSKHLPKHESAPRASKWHQDTHVFLPASLESYPTPKPCPPDLLPSLKESSAFAKVRQGAAKVLGKEPHRPCH